MSEADQEEFEALFRAHFDAVLAYCLARTDADSAKDVTAQTFLVAWRRRSDVPAAGLPWLLGVARRTLADHRRSARRRQNLRDRLVIHRPDPCAGDDPAHEVMERATVVAALRALSPRDREVLQLVAWDGLSPADAAVVLGCSRPAVAVRLSRARRRFANALARHDGPAVTASPIVTSSPKEIR